MRAQMHSVTPMIPSGPSLAEELAFFRDRLGFTVLWQTESMAGIARDGVAFNLVQNDERLWAQNASFSIAVSDLDALYEEFRDLPVPLKAPQMQPWGQRELHMIVPSGVCLQFYERL